MALARKTKLGPFASAALPSLWKAIAKRGWSHSDFARAIKQSTAQASRLLYGERGAGRRTATRCFELFGTNLLLWDKSCPPNWRPHTYDALRPKPAANDDDEGEPALAATGTD